MIRPPSGVKALVDVIKHSECYKIDLNQIDSIFLFLSSNLSDDIAGPYNPLSV